MPTHQSLSEWCKENNKQFILDEWDADKNESLGLSPDSVGCKSTRKVWWLCPLGHSYDMVVHNRTNRGSGCPFCSNQRLLKGFNDLATVCPDICKEWDYEKNKKIHDEDIKRGIAKPHPEKPSEISAGSKVKVYWKCAQGHSFYLAPNTRHVKKDGSFAICNKCADARRTITKTATRAAKNNLAANVPQAAEEWVYSEHGLTPEQVPCNSKEMVHWRCGRGHEFDKRVCDRVLRKNGKYELHQCMECVKYRRTSMVEQAIFYYLKKAFPDAVNTYKANGYEIDIFIPSICVGVEYDGSYYHKKRAERDNLKDVAAEKDGITLYRLRPKKLPDTVSARRITIEEGLEGAIVGLVEFLKAVGAEAPSIDIDRDYNEIYNILQDRTLKSVATSSCINEWDYEKNTVDPHYIAQSESQRQFWWKCPEGHPSYLSCPYNRITRHTVCPVCARKKTGDSRKKKVRNIDTGEVFDSATNAEIAYGHPGNTSISSCCRGRYKTAYGYRWEFVKE